MEIQEYLENLNNNGNVSCTTLLAIRSCFDQVLQVLEYTLFQPGLFLDYLASPYKTAKYVTPMDTFIDFQNRRAVVVEGHENATMTFTAVHDIAGVVTAAVDLKSQWPKIGGIRGNRVTIWQIIKIGEKLRGWSDTRNNEKSQCSKRDIGQPFTIEKVRMEDLEAGNLKTSWTLGRSHPSVAQEQADQLADMIKTVLIGTLLSSAKGAWDVSDDFNQLLPEYKFIAIQDFLLKAWEGKP